MITLKNKWHKLVTAAGFAGKPYYFTKYGNAYRLMWTVRWNRAMDKWDLRDNEYRIIASFLSCADAIRTANDIDKSNEKQAKLLCQ